MTATIATTDLLVAVADPNVTAAIAMADELHRAASFSAQAEAAFEDATADPDCSSLRYRTLRQARNRAADRCAEASARFDRLMAGADDDLCARVEELVWRDREAEYAHARQVSEREDGQRR